jgi:hypothetical protein
MNMPFGFAAAAKPPCSLRSLRLRAMREHRRRADARKDALALENIALRLAYQGTIMYPEALSDSSEH